MAKPNMLRVKLTAVVALSAFVAACSTAPGNYLDTSSLHEEPSNQPKQTFTVHLIDAQLVMQQSAARDAAAHQALPPSRYASAGAYVYHIAPQDILGVTVFDHPELSTPQGSTFSAGGTTTQTVGQALTQPYTTALPGEADPYGQTVAADGTIFFPFVGRVRAAGKTPSQLREQLAAGLVPYVKNPQVDVRVLAYRSQKVQVTGDVSNTERTSGRPMHQDFNLTKYIDKTTPLLNQHCCEGKLFATATITVGRNDAGVVIPLIVYSLTNVIISSVSVGGGGGDKPIENFSLNYATIKWDFSTQKEEGGKEGTVQGKWDLSLNKAA